MTPEPVELRVKRLHHDAVIPSYAHPGDAGFDLCSVDNYLLRPGERALVKTGLAVEIPPGYELQIRPRSGLALKNGVTVNNTPGTIDAGYRGEVGVILINHGTEQFAVTPGMRIAQGVLSRFETALIRAVEELSDTSRGTGGFGSTGTA
jgi:dUTP pyrophosphatase